MSEWKETKLGNELELLYGRSLRESDRRNGKIPVYGSNGIVGFHNEFLTKGPGIIIGRKGSVGEIKFSATDFFPIDTTYYVILKKVNDLKFFYYLLLTLRLDEMNSHSAVPGLNRNDVYSVEVKIPDGTEQRTIAAILSCLDDKIHLLYRQNKTIEAIAETLFRQWFVEEADESWEEDILGNHLSVVDNRGKTPPIIKNKTQYPLIEANALNGDSRLVNYSVVKKYVSYETFQSWFRDRLNKYDTLMTTVGANIGAIAMYVIERGNIAQNIIGLSANIISPFYLYQTLKYKIDEILQLDIGGVQPSIKVPHLLSLTILIPPKVKEQEFADTITPLISKMENNYLEILNLEKLRDTLLPRLMSGEIRATE